MRAVGRHDQCSLYRARLLLCARDAQLGPVDAELQLEHASGAGQLDAPASPQRLPEHRADVPVSDRVAEGVESMLARLESCKPEMTGIGYMNAADGAGRGSNLRPDTE